MQTNQQSREINVCVDAPSRIGPMSARLDNIFAGIIAESPITVFALDANGVINLCTGRAGELTGIKPQDFEEKLREEQSLLEHMLRFHERDRQLIAYEIHDGLVQDVTAAQMLLNSLLKPGGLPEGEARATIQEAGALVQKAVDEARQLIGGLRPPILEEMGVVSAISYLIDCLPANKLTIDFSAKVQFERLEPLLEATIYRIVQQAINNIQRHSRADRAEIRLTRQGEWIHLEIQDWGIGFDPLCVSEDRFGLQGIRERARLMRGRALIDSAPGKGTRINVDLPVAYTLEN